jgi:thiosulfate/3-mercaptopyruvate sulfurtransferase
VWWTFRIFGTKSAHLLDGGLPKWKAEGRPLESGETEPKAKRFTAEMNVGAVALLDDVRMALADDSAQVVDARSAERFAGRAPEPRPGLRSGHMPRSFNVPYDRLIENGRLKSRDKIAAAFAAAGVDLDKPIITTCGSGVTAAVLAFALDALGKEPKGLYDGSWAASSIFRAAGCIAPSRASAVSSSSKAMCATRRPHPTQSKRSFIASAGSTVWSPMPAS